MYQQFVSSYQMHYDFSDASVCEFLLSSASLDQFNATITGHPVPVQTHVVHHLNNCTDEVDEAVEISQVRWMADTDADRLIQSDITSTSD